MARRPSIALIVSAATLAACASGIGRPAPGAAAGAVAAEVSGDPVVSRREWRWTSVSGLELETAHWVIRSSIRSTALLSALPAFYEVALRHYRTGLVPLPDPPKALESYVFGARAEWALFTEHLLGGDAPTYLRMGRGGFTSGGEAVLYDIGERDTLTIAAHEGWHQYSQTTLRNPLPVWLEEGIACYMEGFRRTSERPLPEFMPWRNIERFSELGTARRKGRLIGLRELLEGSPQSFLRDSRDAQLTYYAQVWALVHFLRDGEGGRYRNGLQQLLADAVEGTVADRVRASPDLPGEADRKRALASKAGTWPVHVYFGGDFDGFERSYSRFIEQLADRGSWDRLVRGENPAAPPKQPEQP